jgi:tetratricopeptide (TPR) repeat protein
MLMISGPLLINAEDDPLAAADDLYSKRMNQDNIQKAIDLLKQVVANQPGNCEALWRLTRLYWFLGDKAAKKETKLELFTTGKDYAEQAVKANNNNAKAHYWLGSITGAIGETRGILQSLFMVKPMKQEIETCIQLDPKFADGHDVLAQLYWKAPGPPLSIGNKTKALAESKLAVTYGPNIIEYWLHYGEIARDNKDYTLAREALQKAINLPDDPEDPQSSQKFKAQAAADLQKLEGK